MSLENNLLICGEKAYLRQDWIELFLAKLSGLSITVVLSQNRETELFVADKSREFGIKNILVAYPRFIDKDDFLAAVLERNKKIADICRLGVAFWSGGNQDQNARGLIQSMAQAGKTTIIIPGGESTYRAQELMDLALKFLITAKTTGVR